jgi:hypothetical protein
MECQGCRLPWIGFYGDVIIIDVQPVNNICTDQFNRHRIAGIHGQCNWSIRKLPCFDSKNPFPWRRLPARPRGEGDCRPGRYEKEW